MIPELKKSALRKAEWIDGHGPYASVATCRVLTIECHETIEAAEDAKRLIDGGGCGGGCNGKRGHYIARMPA